MVTVVVTRVMLRECLELRSWLLWCVLIEGQEYGVGGDDGGFGYEGDHSGVTFV